MQRIRAACLISLLAVVPAVVNGADIPFNRTRPLLALCAVLRDRYGLLVTYEDAPADVATELEHEALPNGNTVSFPKWRPVTFHVPDDLPTRADPTLPLNGPIDPQRSLAAVAEVVREYNESGNPGRFTVVQDAEYLHVQQIARTVEGKLEPFEPVSNTLVTLKTQSGTCQQMVTGLSAALFETRTTSLVEAVVPNSLPMHNCRISGGSTTAGKVLEAVVDGINANNLTGEKMVTRAWDLVHDSNWGPYFLSFWVVDYHAGETAGQATPPASAPAKASAPGASRTGTLRPVQPHN